MANALLTGVTGLRIHQNLLETVGNNLANINTTGYKGARVRFGDLVYQTLRQATSATSDSVSGTNPQQIGLGAKIASIDVNFQQGGLESTGNDLDLAIQGNGFFVVNNGVQDVFTRAGAFAVDQSGFLIDPSTGFRVQRSGALGEGDPATPGFQIAGDNSIRIPYNTGVPGQATSSLTLQGNLSANALGPLAHRLTSVQPFRSGGLPATAATLLNNLDDNPVNYVGGDMVRLQGTTFAGGSVNTTFAVDGTTTLGDLLAAVNAAFPGSTASLDAAGNLLLTADASGPTRLSLTVSDVAGNTGSTAWSGHALAVTTQGKAGDVVNTAIQVFDSQGTAHNLTLVFQKQGNNVWDLTASIPAADGTVTDNLIQGITFNDDGSFRQVTGTGLGDGLIVLQFSGIAAPQTVSFSLGTTNGFDGLTQFGSATSAAVTSQDGFAAGFLTTLSVGTTGVINGVFTNGRTLPIAQLALARFGNPGGLNREGDNYFGISTSSGVALIGAGLSGGRGSVQQGTLEQSNIDTASEFTRLITAQRGFQVNARTITVSDQVLQELASIIR